MKFLIFFFIAFGLSEAFKLDCDFVYGADRNKVYACLVKNRFLDDNGDHEVTEIGGQHQDSKTNENVTTFLMEYRNIDFIPKGIGKFFKNLNHISMTQCKVEKISKADFEQFGELN